MTNKNNSVDKREILASRDKNKKESGSNSKRQSTYRNNKFFDRKIKSLPLKNKTNEKITQKSQDLRITNNGKIPRSNYQQAKPKIKQPEYCLTDRVGPKPPMLHFGDYIEDKVGYKNLPKSTSMSAMNSKPFRILKKDTSRKSSNTWREKDNFNYKESNLFQK